MPDCQMSDDDDPAAAERLDAADPLRHLRRVPAEHPLIPPQPLSLRDHLISLSFPAANQNLNDNDSDSDMTVRIHLRVDASPGCGGLAWPAGEVLARYIARRGVNALAHKSVIELGSGTGLVGLVAGALGARRVCITDQAPLLDIMQANVHLNKLAERVDVLEYNWGASKPEGLPAHVDLVLAADCVYFEPAFPLLVATLCDLVANDDPEILFCYKKRRKADKRFFILLKKHFDWKQVDDDPDFATYSREAISLLWLTKKR
ncbi:putative methyltransferase-domain-containing protein [Phellopilus nigrolimitatus]|nr:putative methyltransferase-domain-containing protein [Phellopilus nigrolimitatus]